MTSTTKSISKSSTQLKMEVDAAINAVGQDIVELKDKLTPEHFVQEVIQQDRFAKVRGVVNALRARPYLTSALALGLGALISWRMSSQRKVRVY